MRRTGKLYGLTLVSAILCVAAAVLVVMWNENSSAFHLWFDIVPQGLGMASVITTTLIVRPHFGTLCNRVLTVCVFPGHDSERRERGSSCGDRE